MSRIIRNSVDALHTRYRWGLRLLTVLIAMGTVWVGWGYSVVAQDETLGMVNAFQRSLSGSTSQQQAAAKQVLKNYRDYQKLLTSGQVSAQIAQALDDRMSQMARQTWGEVGKRYPNEVTHVVQVGTFGTRHAPNSKYKPGFSDKDFIPRGSKASAAAKEFTSAFERQWGISPESVDVNALDPTDVSSWPGRKAAALNAEKYNTRGGIAWLERDLYTQNPNVWELDPKGTVQEVSYKQVAGAPPRPLGADDALGFFSDNTRFRQKWLETGTSGPLENLVEHQAKYDLRNVQAYGLSGGKLTKGEAELITATNLLRKGNKNAAIEWMMYITGKSDQEAALAAYLRSMNELNEKMGQEIMRNHISQLASGRGSKELMNELAASLANLPPQYAREAEEYAVRRLGKGKWAEVSKLSKAFKSELAKVRFGTEYFDEMARRYFGQPYSKLSEAEKAVLHNADEAVDTFAAKVGRVIGFSAGGAFAIYAIHDAYVQGLSEGKSGYPQAFARACIELVQLGYPPLIAAELAGRLTAGITDLCASAFTQKQLDELYTKLKEDPSRDIDFLLNTYGVDRYRAGALRQLALEIREEHPGIELPDALIDKKIREYFSRRLGSESLQKKFDEFSRFAEAWVLKNDIPLIPGCDFVSAFGENTRLKQEQPERYNTLLGNLMSQYQSIKDQFTRENRSFTENDIWYELYKIYRGTPPFDPQELVGNWQNGVLVVTALPLFESDPNQPPKSSADKKEQEGCDLPLEAIAQAIKTLKNKDLGLELRLESTTGGTNGTLVLRVIPPKDLAKGVTATAGEPIRFQYRFEEPDELTAEGTLQKNQGYMRMKATIEQDGQLVVLHGTWSASLSQQSGGTAMSGTWRAQKTRQPIAPAKQPPGKTRDAAGTKSGRD